MQFLFCALRFYFVFDCTFALWSALDFINSCFVCFLFLFSLLFAYSLRFWFRASAIFIRCYFLFRALQFCFVFGCTFACGLRSRPHHLAQRPDRRQVEVARVERFAPPLAGIRSHSSVHTSSNAALLLLPPSHSPPPPPPSLTPAAPALSRYHSPPPSLARHHQYILLRQHQQQHHQQPPTPPPAITMCAYENES